MQLLRGKIYFYYKNDGKHIHMLCGKVTRLLVLDLMIHTFSGEP